jgi:hypothetical protein
MANRRFIDFPIATTVGDSDIILIWQSGVNKQTTKATFLSGLPENLDELNDVAISGLTNGQILRYDSVTGKWENTDQGNLDLNDLNDVSIVSPSNGQVLVYNSSTSKWENSSGGFVPYTGAVTTVNLGAQTIQAGSFVKAGGTSSQFLKANGSVDSTAYGTGSVTSVALTMPSAFSVANSPVTTAGTLTVTGAGTVAQYIRGDGSLADFPESSGGGSSVSYYLNGSVSQGTIGGVSYRELSKVPILGAGTDFTINANGYIASFITDAGDPNLLEIPGGNWNLETYFSASSGGGSPTFYVELYKVNSGGTATLIASNSGSPELIAFGTNLTAYFSSLAVPTTTLALTDRLAIRYYVTHSGRTITMHTENNHLCQIITTFTTGLTALNGLTAQVQNFATGTSGTDFNIASATATHTFNLPTASATNRGALSSTDWTTFNGKENAITAGTTAQYFRGDKTFQTLNTSVVPEGTNLYYTDARVNANTNVAANTAARHNAVTLGTANGLSLSTQVLSLGLASAGVTGALSGTDWTTFNNKQNALTNPVTGTGTTNYLPKFTGTSTIGNSALQETNGNLGLGVTPSAWDSQFRALQVRNVSLANFNSNSTLALLNNGYFNTDWRYVSNGSVAMYVQSSNAEHIWYNAPSGTAGNAITFTQAMTLTSGGNLLVGTTTDAGFKLDVNGSGRFSGDVTSGGASQNLFISNGNTFSGFLLRKGGVNKWAIFNNNAGTDFFDIYNYQTGSSNFVITSGGNVGIGTASPGAALQIDNSNATIRLNTTNASNGAGSLQFYNSGTQKFNLTTVATTNDFALYNNGGTNSFNLYIPHASGNVLIGTTTDGGAKLRVNGDILIPADGRLYGNSATVTGSRSYLELYNSSTGNINLVTGFSTASIVFGTQQGNERMRITSGGNVGIGTSSGFNQISGTETTLKIANSNAASLYLEVTGVRGYANYVGAGGNMVWYDYTAGASRMTLTSGGNVLIGTTTDVGAMLHVNGAVRTGAPSGGSAVDWRLGTARGGTITPNAIVRVEIGGVLVDLDARYV